MPGIYKAVSLFLAYSSASPCDITIPPSNQCDPWNQHIPSLAYLKEVCELLYDKACTWQKYNWHNNPVNKPLEHGSKGTVSGTTTKSDGGEGELEK